MLFFILNIHLSCLSLLSRWTQTRAGTQTGMRRGRGKNRRKTDAPNSSTLLLLKQRLNLQLLIPPKRNHPHFSLFPLLPLFVFLIKTQNLKHCSPIIIIIIITGVTITQTAGRRLPVQLPPPRLLLLTWLPNCLCLHLPLLPCYRLQWDSSIHLRAPLLVLYICRPPLLPFPFCPHLQPVCLP